MKNKLNKLILLAVLSFVAAPAFAEYTSATPDPSQVKAQAPQDTTVWDLQHLTELLKDGEEGYKLSAAGVKNQELKRLFTQYASQRTQFLSDLRKEVSRLGGDPDKGGTALGAAHRGWINVREAISKNEDRSIVDEVLKGEKVALKDYEDALQKDLPVSTRRLVQLQKDGIQSAYDAVQAIDIRQEKQS